MRKIATVMLVAALAASLSACGRKGRPIPPEGAITRHYPEIDFPQGPARTQEQAPDQERDQGMENTSR